MDRGSNNYRRFLDGDDTGMEEIIRDYRDGLIFYLNKVVGSIEIAEDLAEDTFVLLCIKKPKDKQKSSFKTWLYAIGRNIAIDYLRRFAKQNVLPLDRYYDAPCDQESPEEEYIRDSKKIVVNKALMRLKPEYRQVLWLFYFENMRYKEISKIMNKSEHATQMIASRAREALKIELLKEGFTDEDH